MISTHHRLVTNMSMTLSFSRQHERLDHGLIVHLSLRVCMLTHDGVSFFFAQLIPDKHQRLHQFSPRYCSSGVSVERLQPFDHVFVSNSRFFVSNLDVDGYKRLYVDTLALRESLKI